MDKNTREILEALVENVETLKSFNFEKHVQKIGLGFEARRTNDNNWVIEFKLPDDKELHAFLFKFRLFIQRNEPISLFKLQDLMADTGLSENWKIKARAALNGFLIYYHSHPEDIAELFGNAPTHGEILDIFLYGELAHTGLNPKFKYKRQMYKKWTGNEFISHILTQKFIEITLEVFKILVDLDAITQEELYKNRT